MSSVPCIVSFFTIRLPFLLLPPFFPLFLAPEGVTMTGTVTETGTAAGVPMEAAGTVRRTTGVGVTLEGPGIMVLAEQVLRFTVLPWECALISNAMLWFNARA